MATKIDYSLIGKTFNYLTIIDTIKIGINTRMVCKCICGNVKHLYQNRIVKGIDQSCGCMKYTTIAQKKTKHGQNTKSKTTKEYKAWSAMKVRCYNEKFILYPRWGGRGVIVCDRWKNSFENFFEDMGKAPSSKHSLDRFPNNDGNYEPGNARWATRKEQGRNNSYNVMIELDGELKCVTEWSEIYKVSSKLIFNRIYKGWSLSDSVKTPLHVPRNTVSP